MSYEQVYKKIFDDQNIKILEWAPKNPDLNIIENFWSEVKRLKGNYIASDLNDLVFRITRAIHEIDPNYIKNIYNSIPRRLEAIVNANGYATKY